MKTSFDHKKFFVLYVDDEAQAIKYFAQAYGDSLSVLTASSVDEAERVLDEYEGRIGVVITDQRMPQRSGTDLLAKLRAERPQVIRILTTAFSDLPSAIDAVNEGAIYKYVVKPWDLHDLRIMLMRALEFFMLQQERDLLLREKVGTLQRLSLTDRVKSLTVLAASLGHRLKYPLEALQQYLDQTPEGMQEFLSEGYKQHPEQWTNIREAAKRETAAVLKVVSGLAEVVAEPHYTFADEVDLEELIRAAAEQVHTLGGETSIDVAIDIATDLPMFKVDRELLRRMLTTLIEQTARLSPPGSRLMISAADKVDVWGTPGIRIVVSGEGSSWEPDRVMSLFSAFSGVGKNGDVELDLLNAFFIAHHHGGSLTVKPTAPDGPGFEVRVPFAPSAVNKPTLEDDLMEKLLLRFDLWRQD